jgi:hypothetical protein
MIKTLTGSLICVGLLAGVLYAQLAAPAPKIIVGPNILASRDGDFYHVETMVAANPKNSRNLVGAAITPTQADGSAACRIYTTLDGGYTWRTSIVPEQEIYGGADPQIAFSPQGVAYFAALALAKDERGRTGAYLYFYRSEDGVVVWSKPANLGASYDHPQIAVDHTVGRYAGRVYLGVLYGRDYSLGVFRSDDGGRTFTGPVKVTDGGGIGVNVTQMMVLSDGLLAMTYADFQIDPAKRKEGSASNSWIVTSKDGGITFSKPAKITTLRALGDENNLLLRLFGFNAYAADSRSQRFRDRLYAAWTDFASGKPRVLFSFSTDGGQRWKAARQVDPATPADSTQFQPALAVSTPSGPTAAQARSRR